MAKHVVPITNGVGSLGLTNATYTVTSQTSGYDDTSITPAEQEITEGVNEYSFTIAATGTLTLHVSDDGTDAGVPVVGAKFARCDAEGNNYGEEITSNEDGNAVFNSVPFAAENAPSIYYKQTVSDAEHEFDSTLKTISLAEETLVVEIQNAEAVSRNFTFTDANYENLPIADGNIELE